MRTEKAIRTNLQAIRQEIETLQKQYQDEVDLKPFTHLVLGALVLVGVGVIAAPIYLKKDHSKARLEQAKKLIGIIDAVSPNFQKASTHSFSFDLSSIQTALKNTSSTALKKPCDALSKVIGEIKQRPGIVHQMEIEAKLTESQKFALNL